MKQWRPTTWLVLAVNIAFAIWLVAALGFRDPCDLRGEVVAACAGPTPTGPGGIGAMTIVGLWTLANIVLAFVWFGTKKRAGGNEPDVRGGGAPAPRAAGDSAARAGEDDRQRGVASLSSSQRDHAD